MCLIAGFWGVLCDGSSVPRIASENLNVMNPQAHLTPQGVGDGLWSCLVSHLCEDDSDILARVGLYREGRRAGYGGADAGGECPVPAAGGKYSR